MQLIKKIVQYPFLFCLFLYSMAVNADSTVSITLQGLVDSACFSTFVSDGDGQNLNLSLDANDVLAASGTLYCNEPEGFTVSLASKNGQTVAVNSGLFLATTADSGENRLPYNLKFESASSSATVDFVSGVASSQITGTPGTAVSETFQVLISYTGDVTLASDTYTDELTLSIVAL
jgi:hypothetical protein